MDSFLTHPEPAKRVGAILEWAESEDYRNIIDGRYLRKFEVEAMDRIQIEGVRSCPLCLSPVGQAKVCPKCELPQDSERQQRCSKHHLAGLDWKFCKVCGSSLTLGARRSETLGC